MITISIRHNFPKVAAELNRLGQAMGDKAMVRALNATVTQAKPAMARQIASEFRVTSSQAKERLDIRRASSKSGGLRLEAALLATRKSKGRGMNLINFVVGGRPARNSKGRMAQLKMQIKRAGGRKVIPGAFIATNRKTGGEAVFVRDGKSRYPIITKTTVDIPQMFNTRRINSVVREVMIKRFDINFNREARSLLKGYAK